MLILDVDVCGRHVLRQLGAVLANHAALEARDAAAGNEHAAVTGGRGGHLRGGGKVRQGPVEGVWVRLDSVR